MAGADKQLVERALSRDSGAVRALVGELTPVIQARVARALLRSHVRRRTDRSVRQELEDLTQEGFLSLFDANGRALRAWDPGRGLSLSNFVGLLAQRQVASILRSGKRSPWTEDPAEMSELDAAGDAELDEPRFESREMLELLLARMRESLSPRGLELFQRLCVDNEPVESVVRTTGMSADAVYAWRSRLRRLAVQLADELSRESSSEMSGSARMPTRDASS